MGGIQNIAKEQSTVEIFPCSQCHSCILSKYSYLNYQPHAYAKGKSQCKGLAGWYYNDTK